MKEKRLIIFLILSVFLVSCIEAEQVEKIGIINARGLDVLQDDRLESTLVIYQLSEEADSISKTRSGKGNTVKGALTDTENETSFKLVPGKIKLEMYGKETAKKGIMPYLDTIYRDARMSDLMYITISDTTAKEILSAEEKDISKNVGQFLYELIKNNFSENNIPRKTLFDFFQIYHDIGQDNVLPILELDEGVPRQKALAIMQHGKYVGEVQNEEATLINLVNSTIKKQEIELTLPISPFKKYLEKGDSSIQSEALQAAFRIEKSKSKNKVVDEQDLTFKTDIKIEMRLLEQTAGIEIKNQHVVKQLEKEIEKNLEAQLQGLLTQLQELNADPFGYGRYYRIHRKDGKLTDEQWREKFPHIKVNFNLDVNMFRFGITE